MDELLGTYHMHIAEMALHPSSGGVFEVTLDGETLFSKKETGRFPEPGEIAGLLTNKCGWDAGAVLPSL